MNISDQKKYKISDQKKYKKFVFRHQYLLVNELIRTEQTETDSGLLKNSKFIKFQRNFSALLYNI